MHGRIGSISKRPRTEEETGRDNKNYKSAISGTANSSMLGRKMKVPPADIFFWGLLPETSIEYIVCDLRMQAKRPSYIVSVPASDL